MAGGGDAVPPAALAGEAAAQRPAPSLLRRVEAVAAATTPEQARQLIFLEVTEGISHLLSSLPATGGLGAKEAKCPIKRAGVC